MDQACRWVIKYFSCLLGNAVVQPVLPCYCCPARQAVRCICMYYMLVRLSVCLNHIKGTIIIIIITQTSQQSLRFVSGVVVCHLVCRLAVDILNIIFSHALSICRLIDSFDAKMCELTLQMILLCNCSLSLNVCNIGLQCNLRFLSTTVLQGSVATQVNYGKIFIHAFAANLLLSVKVKEF